MLSASALHVNGSVNVSNPTNICLASSLSVTPCLANLDAPERVVDLLATTDIPNTAVDLGSDCRPGRAKALFDIKTKCVWVAFCA